MTRPISRPRKVTVLISRIEQDCNKNIELLINQGKKTAEHWGVEWNSTCWDVSGVFRHAIRSHRSDRKHWNLWFSQRSEDGVNPGAALPAWYGDVVKSMVVLRHQAGGQCFGSQAAVINASQFIYQQLEKTGRRIIELTPGDLHQACRTAAEVLSPTTAYGTQATIEAIAAFVDKNRLCIRRLDFRYPHKHRPLKQSELDAIRLDDTEYQASSSRRPIEEDVMKAVGLLYQKIPKSNVADRLRINIVVIAAFTGRRIGEILTMPFQRMSYGADGHALLKTYVQKRSQGCQIVIPDKLDLIPQTASLLKKVVDECVELTAAARDAARHIKETSGPDARMLPESPWIDSVQLRDALGLSPSSRTTIEWIQARHIEYRIGRGGRAVMKRADVITAMHRELFAGPALHVTPPAADLGLDDLMFIGFKNQFHATKADLRYAVWPLNVQHISDFLGARGGGAFARYLNDTDAEGYRVTTHQFRHTLNTLLQRGGLSDALQTEWFQRKRSSDTKAYQHMTQAEKILAARNAMKGPGKQLPPTFCPVDREESNKSLETGIILDLGPGFCRHDWHELPCPRHAEATLTPTEFYWVPNDNRAQLQELERLRQVCLRGISAAEARIASGRSSARAWADHLLKRLADIDNILKNLS